MYKITEMTVAQAKLICGWTYEPPYSVYNFGSWEVAVNNGYSIADACQREKQFRAVLDEQGELAGYLRMTEQEDGSVELGWGMSPKNCGIGKGQAFVEAVSEYALAQFPGRRLMLEVRTFNKRALKCYEKSGYISLCTRHMVMPYGEDDYVLMQHKGTIDKHM